MGWLQWMGLLTLRGGADYFDADAAGVLAAGTAAGHEGHEDR